MQQILRGKEFTLLSANPLVHSLLNVFWEHNMVC